MSVGSGDWKECCDPDGGRLGGDSGDKWEMSFAEDGSCYDARKAWYELFDIGSCWHWSGVGRSCWLTWYVSVPSK